MPCDVKETSRLLVPLKVVAPANRAVGDKGFPRRKYSRVQSPERHSACIDDNHRSTHSLPPASRRLIQLAMAFHLLALPHEVIHFILTLVDPQDIAALSCCRSLHQFIQSDRLLCKELYLKNYVGNMGDIRVVIRSHNQ